MATISVSEEFKDRVYREKERNETYEECLDRLIGWEDGDGDGDGPSFGIKP